jgi:sulfate-transporting ATPase
MQEVIVYALIGLGLGALYALSSQGLMVIYRGSGVLNFAQGAIGMLGAYVAWDLQTNSGLPFIPALIVGVAVSALIGVLTQLLLMRPLRRAAPLVRVVATLGVLILLQGIVILHWGAETIVVDSSLPTSSVHLFGSVNIAADRLILLAIACASTGVLWWLYKFTSFGLATGAVAENQRSAAALGWSPDRIATANWALGSALAGFAAILIAPIIQLQPSTMTNLVLAAMAAALIASFRSFPLALAGGLAIGVGQTEIQHYITSVPGLASSFPFLVIVGVMLLRGQSLPLRDAFLQRLPSIGTGRVRLPLVIGGIVLYGAGIVLLDTTWVTAFSTTFGVALVLLSIVVVTGYAGQISLAQFAIAGGGAYIAGRLMATQGWPFELALVAGMLGAVPLAMVFALPAVRTRGISLAIVTFGLGTAVELMVFNNPKLTGGQVGTVVKPPDLFGFSLDPLFHPQRYAWFAMAVFLIGALAVAALRRGRSGRQMIAIRTNERAAAALGINVPAIKLYAFGVSGALAALGGIILAFRNTSILYNQFTSLTSVNDLAYTVIGGIGFIHGPSVGAWFAPGSLGSALGDTVFGNIGDWLLIIAGAVLCLTVLRAQDGVAKLQIDQSKGLTDLLERKAPWIWRPPEKVEIPEIERERVEPKTLRIKDLTVRYGAVVAVQGFSTTVEPGKVVGLIGPNGAGKTTVIDAVTGFTRPAEGTVELDGRDVTSRSASARARAGLSRSFQSLELFEDVTVLDNLRTASDPRDRISYVRDLIHPVDPPLHGATVAAIREFNLEADIDRVVEDLDYGRRRLLAIARAVAINPSVLLLDEPAAGLGQAESRELARLVRRLADEWGMAILLIEHDMDFVMSICDQVEVLDFGRPIASGPPSRVQSDPAVIAAYLGEPEDEVSAATVSEITEITEGAR